MNFPRMTVLAAISTLTLAGCQQAETAKTDVQSAAQAQMTPTLSTTDATFLNTIAPGGAAEVKMGQLAEAQASSPAVRKFAHTMVVDHGWLNDRVMTLATTKQLTISPAPDMAQDSSYSTLQGLHGRHFNKAYMDNQVMAHQQTVQAFQTEIASGTDPDVKAFATRFLPRMQEHLTMAQALDRRA